MEGQAVGRQLLVELGAVRGVTGVDALPVWGGAGERQQVRPVVGERVNERQNLIARIHTHVHVHAVDDHVAAPILGALHDAPIAFFGHDGLLGPAGERVRARRVELDTQPVGNLANGVGQLLQLAAGLRHGRADAGDDLDGVLQEFPGHVCPVGGGLQQFGAALAQDAEHLCGALGQFAAFTVDECNLPFHAEGGLRGGSKVDHRTFPASGNSVVHSADYGSLLSVRSARQGTSW